MNDLAVLGESLRRDLDDWLHARCAGWLPGDALHIDGLAATQAIPADTAALLTACYQAVALDAWLTAGYLPAEQAVFDEQVTAMALADSGVDTAARGPGAAAAGAAPASSRAWPEPANAAIASRRPGAPERADTKTVSDTRSAADAPLRSVMPAGDQPAARPVIEDGPPRASAAGAGTRPAASGFQRLKGLHELVTAVQSLDGAAPALDAAGHGAASPRSPSMPGMGQDAPPAALGAEPWPRATTAPGPARMTGSPARPAPGRAPGAWPGAEPDALSAIASAPGPAVRTSSAAGERAVRAAPGTPGMSGRGDESGVADARASVGLEELLASFRPLMERTDGPSDAAWPAGVTDRAAHVMPAHASSAPGQGRPRSAQLSRPEPAMAASWPGLAPGMPTAGAEPAEPPSAGAELTTPSARAGQRARAGEQTLAAAPMPDGLLPSDIESVLEAIAEDLERDFARLYGGG